MGNKSVQQRKVNLEDLGIYKHNNYYPYDIKRDVFDLEIIFNSTLNIKRTLQYICQLSLIDATTEKIYGFPGDEDYDCNETEEITVVKIQGAIVNLFKFAEHVLMNSAVSSAFQRIKNFDMAFEKGKPLKWPLGKKATVRIMKTKFELLHKGQLKKKRSFPSEKIERLQEKNINANFIEQIEKKKNQRKKNQKNMKKRTNYHQELKSPLLKNLFLFKLPK